MDARVGEEVVVGVRLRKGRTHVPLPAGSRVRFLRVVPRLARTAPPGPGRRSATYTNGVFGGPDHGRWLGYDQLEYDTIPFEPGENVSISEGTLSLTGSPDVDHPETPSPPRRSARARDAGTLFIAAEVELMDGQRLRTPGAESVDRLGLSPRVLRVSYRTGDAFVDWLSAFFDVPYVFGSTAPQANRRTGIDCADVMVAAAREQGHGGVRYTSVTGIERFARAVSDVLLLDEEGQLRHVNGRAATLLWNEDVLPGDLVTIDYQHAPGMPRAWDHIGALVADSGESGPDGRLDGRDLLRHMSLRGLTDEPLSGQGLIRLRLHRWRHQHR